MKKRLKLDLPPKQIAIIPRFLFPEKQHKEPRSLGVKSEKGAGWGFNCNKV